MIDWLYFIDYDLGLERILAIRDIKTVTNSAGRADIVTHYGEVYRTRESFSTIRSRCADIAVRSRKRYMIRENPD